MRVVETITPDLTPFNVTFNTPLKSKTTNISVKTINPQKKAVIGCDKSEEVELFPK